MLRKHRSVAKSVILLGGRNDFQKVRFRVISIVPVRCKVSQIIVDFGARIVRVLVAAHSMVRFVDQRFGEYGVTTTHYVRFYQDRARI